MTEDVSYLHDGFIDCRVDFEGPWYQAGHSTQSNEQKMCGTIWYGMALDAIT